VLFWQFGGEEIFYYENNVITPNIINPQLEIVRISLTSGLSINLDAFSK
jgi:hypothetical protein